MIGEVTYIPKDVYGPQGSRHGDMTVTAPLSERVFCAPWMLCKHAIPVRARVHLPTGRFAFYYTSEVVWIFDGKVTGLGYYYHTWEAWRWLDNTPCEGVCWCHCESPELIETIVKDTP